jgi:hypothetical protein
LGSLGSLSRLQDCLLLLATKSTRSLTNLTLRLGRSQSAGRITSLRGLSRLRRL